MKSVDIKFKVSDEVKEWISKLNSSIEARVIPYWVKRNNIKKVNNDKLTIGFLGRLNKNKGIEDLLHALNKLNYKENNLDVIIGGHGDEKYIKKLKSILNEEVNKYVDFLGFVFYNKSPRNVNLTEVKNLLKNEGLSLDNF